MQVDGRTPFSGAAMEAFDPSTGFVQGSTVTDANGNFVLSGLEDRTWIARRQTPGSLIQFIQQVKENWIEDEVHAQRTTLSAHGHAQLRDIGPDDHHPKIHGLVSSEHTVSGLTTGQVLTALSPTTFGFAALGAPPSHSHAETDITNGSLLARVADTEVITGEWIFHPANDGITPISAQGGTTGYLMDLRDAADATIFSIDYTGHMIMSSVSTGQFEFNNGAGGQVILDLSLSGASAAYTFPDGVSGQLLTNSSSTTLTNKQISCPASVTGNQYLRAAASTSQRVYPVLNVVGNNSLSFSSTAARDWEFKNVAGTIVAVGNEAAPPSTDNLGSVDLTGRTATIAATNLTSATAVTGFYRITYEITCTTGGTGITLTFNTIATGDSGGSLTVAQAVTLPLTTATASATNPIRGSVERYVASGALQYSTTGTIGTSAYAIRVRSEYLG